MDKDNENTKHNKAKFILLIVLAVLLIALLVALVIYNSAPSGRNAELTEGKIENPAEAYRKIASENENVTYDEAQGFAFINNRIMVIMKNNSGDKYNSEKNRIEQIAQNYDAEVDESMGSLGIYRLILPQSKNHSELSNIAEEIAKNDRIDSAFIDPVSLYETSANDTKTPNDSWNGASWNQNVPRDENWNVEAVRALSAWSHLDDMNEITIGQIDGGFANSTHPDLKDANLTNLCMFTDDYNLNYSVKKVTNIDENNSDEHATHVAGTMTASWNNSIGISGATGNKVKFIACASQHILEESAFSQS